jgi:hypothetical protein
MNKYENDFIYGKTQLKKLLIATGIGCVVSLLSAQYSWLQVIALCMTTVFFATAIACIVKYCRCPSCNKVIAFGVLVVKTCPRCHRSLITGKKMKK